jgi:4-amino-4-deoxy-L-arabinose transferase-like glycosyltransferase
MAVFLLQYLFRSFDDNRLTSWKWTFVNVDLAWFMPGLIVGTFFVYAVFRSSFAVQKPLLFLAISSFAVSTIFWKTPEVIMDSSRYFTQAKHLEAYGASYFLKEWGNGINAWTDLPLMPFIYGLVFKFFGESRAYIQIITSSLFSMTVVVTCLTGRTLWDEETGFFAGAMLLGIPYLYSQIPLMLVDVPTMFFLTLSIFTFIKAMESGRGWILFSALSIFCAVLSKYSTWMMLSVLVVIFLVYWALGDCSSNINRGCILFEI